MPVLWSLRLAGLAADPVPLARLHGLACALVEGPESAHTAQVKPFSARMADSRSHGPVVEIGWLDDVREPELGTRISEGGLRLGDRPFQAEIVGRRAVSYAELAASAPAVKARVVFASPTYVNRAGRQIPLPDPELLLAGLARRWRAFSPVPVIEETLTALSARVFVARHEIRTASVAVGRARRVGFTGEVVFGLPPEAPLAVRRLFVALWRFAEYAGTGAQTTHGLGRVEYTGG